MRQVATFRLRFRGATRALAAMLVMLVAGCDWLSSDVARTAVPDVLEPAIEEPIRDVG